MITQLIKPRSFLFRSIIALTTFLWLWNGLHPNLSSTQLFIFTHNIKFVLALVIILFAVIPWYGRIYKGLGIEDHYEKMLLPTIYLLLIDQILLLFHLSFIFWNFFLIVLFLVVILLNALLLYYHFKDKDKTPPAYFAANLYLAKIHEVDEHK